MRVLSPLLFALLAAAPAWPQDASAPAPPAGADAQASAELGAPGYIACLSDRDDDDDDDKEERLVVFPGVRRTLDLASPALQQVRRDLLAGLPVHLDDLRALAGAQDGLAALCLVRHLLDHPESGASDIETATLAALAVGTGRTRTLRPLIDALLRLDPAAVTPEQVALLSEVIYAHAWAGDARALDAVIDLNGEGRLFGTMSDDTRAHVLEMGARAGDGRAAFRLALADLRDPDGDDRARQALLAAQAEGGLSVRTMATTLLARLDAVGSAVGTSR